MLDADSDCSGDRASATIGGPLGRESLLAYALVGAVLIACPAGCGALYDDTPSRPGFVVDGAEAGDRASLIALVDVDGDGRDDLVVEAAMGRVYVVFGREGTGPVDLAEVAAGEGGFAIEPGDVGEVTWRAFADVDGDGRVDLVATDDDGGWTYVVFGGARGGSKSSVSERGLLRLDALKDGEGLIIDHATSEELTATRFGDLVDVNGDGFADLVFGYARNGAEANANLAVIDGGPGLTSGTLPELATGTHGRVEAWEELYDVEVIEAAVAGDVDGDGFDDILVHLVSSGGYFFHPVVLFHGGPSETWPQREMLEVSDQDGFSQRGFGGNVDLNGDGLSDVYVHGYGGPWSEFSAGHVVIVRLTPAPQPGPSASWYSGGATFAVSVDDRQFLELRGIGDVNADGLDDIVVTTDVDEVRRTVIVYGVGGGSGGRREVDRDVLPKEGVELSVPAALPIGDVSGDGQGELVLLDRRSEGGTARRDQLYVVYGHDDWSGGVDLEAIADGEGGFLIEGERRDDDLGAEVAVGDIDGDGLGDLVVAAPEADANGTSSGRIYVYFGAQEL